MRPSPPTPALQILADDGGDNQDKGGQPQEVDAALLVARRAQQHRDHLVRGHQDEGGGKGREERIACPTLVCDAEDDLFFDGQPQQLFDHLTCPRTLLRFTTAEGAGAHCHNGAQRLAFARIYDWLDDVLMAV